MTDLSLPTDRVRLLDQGGWFYEGTVTAIDVVAQTVEVDFGDFIHVYRHADLRESTALMQDFLVPTAEPLSRQTF